MRKIIISTISNIICIALFAMYIIMPVEIESDVAGELGIKPSIYFIIFWIVIPVLLIIKIFMAKKSGRNVFSSFELASDDEREAEIVSKTLRFSYQLLVSLLFLSMGIIAVLKIFFADDESIRHFFEETLSLDIFAITVILLSLSLSITQFVHCVKWCRAYKS